MYIRISCEYVQVEYTMKKNDHDSKDQYLDLESFDLHLNSAYK